MIRRSKIKARPAIKKHQTSSQGKISSQASTPKLSQESPASEKNQNDNSLHDPNPSDSISLQVECSPAIESCEPTVSDRPDKTPGTEASILAHSDGNSNTDNADSQTSKVAAKPQMARRRKLVACPTMAKKRQKTVHPDPKPENKTPSVPAPLEIAQSSHIHPTDVFASCDEALVMSIPAPPQATPVENDVEEESSADLATLSATTITTISLGAEEEVENSNQSYASLNTVDPWMVPGDENTELQSHGSHHEQPDEATMTGDAAVSRNSSSSHDEQASNKNSTELKIFEPKKTENAAVIKNPHVSAKVKIVSVTTKHRNNAMAKLRKLKEGQQDDEKWPELDQNVVSMSDLIFLNPPNRAGLKLGMNVQRETMEQTMPEREKTPEPEPSTSTPEEKEPDALPVPQIRIAEDGSVVIDEESLVMDTQKPPDRRAHTVYEIGREGMVNQRSFLRRPHARPSRWSQQETDKFYRCLCIVGAEFSLMGAMFRARSADDLRRKFKRERKTNPVRVDNALMHQHLSKWTDDMFEPKDGSEDNTEALNVSRPPQETVK